MVDLNEPKCFFSMTTLDIERPGKDLCSKITTTKSTTFILFFNKLTGISFPFSSYNEKKLGHLTTGCE